MSKKFEGMFPAGEVVLIDSMGDDLRVVNAARVSMAKEHAAFQGGKDDKLLQYMANHAHWTPFSHVMVTLRIKMPLFIMREWYRHTIGFTRNEESRRYVDYTPDCFLPDTLRLRAPNVKQGSSDETIATSEYTVDLIPLLLTHYDRLIERGVAPEQARIFLPQGMYTTFYETASLYAYARLCRQRLDPHAQEEIQVYARAVSDILDEVAPRSWEVLLETD